MQIHPKTDVTEPDWIKDFDYDESQIHNISIGFFNLQDDKYTVIPIISSNLSNEKNLVFGF